MEWQQYILAGGVETIIKQRLSYIFEKDKKLRRLKKRIYIFVITVAVFFISMVASGQKKKPMNKSWYDEQPLHFGFSVGFNSMDFDITKSQDYLAIDSIYPEVSLITPGINIQVIMDLRPSKYLDIRFLPGVSFGQRSIIYYKEQNVVNDLQKVESSFLEFPLLLKYKGMRLNNVRPYVISGLNFRHDLAGRKEFDDEEPVYLRLHRADLYYEIGAGLDMYLPYFKLAIELKMSNGLRNILVDDPYPGQPQYVNAIEALKSRMWVLAFHFE